MPQLAENRRARYDYEILETFDAGIELSGHEAKSAKLGNPSVAGGHGIIRGGEAYLVGVELPSFQPQNAPDSYDPARVRKLLLKRDEIQYLTGKLQEQLTLIPLSLYTERGLVKVKLGLGKGRKKRDRREYLKKRQAQREIEQHTKRG